VKKASGSAKRVSELSQADSPVSAVQTHSISILPAFKDVIGTMDTTLKRDRLAGRFQGRSRSRFRIADREMVPAADRKTLIYIVLAIEVSTFVLLTNACLMLTSKFYRNKTSDHQKRGRLMHLAKIPLSLGLFGRGVLNKIDPIEILMELLFDSLSTLEFRSRLLNVRIARKPI
jgi:hypothetical protein